MSLISGNEETLWQYQVSNETKVWFSPAWIHWNWRKFLYLEDKTTSRYWISGSTESLEIFFRINVFKMLEIMVRLLLLLMMKSIMIKIMIRYWEFWYHAAAVAGNDNVNNNEGSDGSSDIEVFLLLLLKDNANDDYRPVLQVQLFKKPVLINYTYHLQF